MRWPTPHVRAWYSLSIAAEPYSTVGGVFLSLLLERQARSLGYWAPDLVVPCAEVAEGSGACKTLIFGRWIETNSFSLYVKSLAMLLQAVVILSLGPSADNPYWRKRLVITCSLIGATTAITFLGLPAETHTWVLLVAAMLTVVGYISYSLTVVCANAFLPALASEDTNVKEALEDIRPTHEERQTLIPTQRKTYSLTMSRLSSFYLFIGMTMTVIILALLEVLLIVLRGTTQALQICIGLTGLWWLVFTLPAFRLPGGDGNRDTKIRWTSGLRRIGKMVRPDSMGELPNLYRFLLAWFFLSDGFHTVPLTMILYASSRLQIPPDQLVPYFFLPLAGMALGSLVWPWIQGKIGCTNRTTMFFCIAVMVLVPLWASLGLVFPWAGVRTRAGLNIMILVGISEGPFFSYARAVYAEMIPVGHESSYFSLFALADKSAAFTGPLIVGLITQTTGEFGYAFAFVVVLILLPVPVLLSVNIDEAHEQAKRWVEDRKDEVEEEVEGLVGAPIPDLTV